VAELRISWVDVFTDRPFAGNPLAVVPDADGLDDGQMQTLAAELGLSETTFVFDGARRLRIFTPNGELPLAGHPVIGATVELGRLGLLADGVHVFLTGVGETPVELRDGLAPRPRGGRRARHPCRVRDGRAAGVRTVERPRVA
jgi:trans-2,3-dihydro-3-hydroxyanthranilate isomerase